ncbi:unnamed protein product [Spirodela intermedia]|uniref:BRX domain-containing protein n=1 Tax=Spirodela intermedia TaxID=51605 RepID=A0A7I8J1Z8_SPIIN|nr:unnamed protein product [Spirodela intermedia]CAA6664244.1 unnamed protein product [Spirodela intermedia]
MLTCIACSKQISGSLQQEPEDDDGAATPSTRHAIRALTAQIKDMAMKASGAYRQCKPCARQTAAYADSDAAAGSERFHYAYQRAAACSGLGSSSSTPREVTPSMSGRSEVSVVVAEEEQREWVAQVEPGVLITFISLPHGGNDLKRIRFSRELFNKWHAQRWWAENYDKVMELYNVQRFSRQAVPLPTPPRSEDESSKVQSSEDSPVTPPPSSERLPRNLHRPPNADVGSSCHDFGGLAAAPPTLSSISAAKTETSSVDASGGPAPPQRTAVRRALRLRQQRQRPRERVGRAGRARRIHHHPCPPGGIRELRRVRFSRERFSEMHARLWWEENRARIHQQYL